MGFITPMTLRYKEYEMQIHAIGEALTLLEQRRYNEAKLALVALHDNLQMASEPLLEVYDQRCHQ